MSKKKPDSISLESTAAQVLGNARNLIFEVAAEEILLYERLATEADLKANEVIRLEKAINDARQEIIEETGHSLGVSENWFQWGDRLKANYPDAYQRYWPLMEHLDAAKGQSIRFGNLATQARYVLQHAAPAHYMRYVEARKLSKELRSDADAA